MKKNNNGKEVNMGKKVKTVKKDVIHANGIDIGIYSEDLQNDYISSTDIAKKGKGNIRDMLFKIG